MSDAPADRAAATVVRLLHEAGIATLATLESGGAPYASLVAVAADDTGAPILLLSDLARHTGNLKRDPRVSLLLADERGTDPLNAPRASLIGSVGASEEKGVRERYLERHQAAEGYADFSDFRFYRMTVEEVHLVEGFGRISTLPGAAAAIDWAGAEALRAGQAGIVGHMNEDHLDAIDLYAQRLLGAEGEGWRMLSFDPEGCDLIRGQVVRRLDFPQRITSLVAAREVLVALAQKARA